MNESQPESFKNYTRRCLYFFLAILCGTGLMVATSFTPIASSLRVALILVVACLNAALVSGFLMHLISEKRAVYTLLIFTAIFFVGLMGLSIWAHGDVPHLKGI
jgi:cytochrome c oxidase subunit IV